MTKSYRNKRVNSFFINSKRVNFFTLKLDSKQFYNETGNFKLVLNNQCKYDRYRILERMERWF